MLEYIFGTYLGVSVFGHYSPNTIHRYYSLARGALSARCLVVLNQVWFLVWLHALLGLHVCMCVSGLSQKLAKASGLAWNSVGELFWHWGLGLRVCVCVLEEADWFGLSLTLISLALSRFTLS